MTDEEINTRTAKKGIGLQTTLCKNGVINCWSESGSGKAHSVFVDSRGKVIRCTCKGYKHTGSCYHVDKIRQDGSLRAAARACTTQSPVATDGGQDNTGNLSTVDPYPDDEEIDDTPL
jgi:hypothetical protein